MPIRYPKAPSSDLLKPGDVLKDRWKIRAQLGVGGYGQIYVAEDKKQNTEVAVKVEPAGEKTRQVLRMETAVLRSLMAKNARHACTFYGAGMTKSYNFVVMYCCGKNLADLRRISPNLSFSPSTALRVGRQMLDAIREVHEVGFLHRDIKPSNFAIGKGDYNRTVFVFDFGLARQYLTVKLELRPQRSQGQAGFRGTVRYASLTSHRQEDMGRHDDLWSLFYVFIESLAGSLPWRRIRDKDAVYKAKLEAPASVLTQAIPEPSRQALDGFADNISKLTYHDTPDYTALDGCLQKALVELKVEETDAFDWEEGYKTVAEEMEKLSSTQPYRQGSKSRKKEGATDVPEELKEGDEFGGPDFE